MNEQQKELLKLLKLLQDNDCLNHLILIGSWAEYMYMAAAVLPEYEAQIKTLDIDFLIKNMKKPVPQVNIVPLVKEIGYDVEIDRITGVTKLLSRKGLEVEFLISQKGNGESAALKTNLGVTAQALRHLDLLKGNTIAIEYLGIEVVLPEPEAFVLHKMIINHQRKEKIEKDKNVINRMYRHLDMERFKSLQESLTKKERKAIAEYMAANITPMLEKEKKLEEAKKHLG